MKKVFLVIFLTQFTTSACALNTLPLYKEEINEITRDPKTRRFKGSENDLSDLAGCEILVEMSESKIMRVGKNGKHKYYGRSQSWIKGTMVTETGVSIDFNPQQNSVYFVKQGLTYFVYIGPWHFSPSIQKFIRFFAYYPKEGGDIKYQYESQTPENKLIPEKKFSLSKNAKIAFFFAVLMAYMAGVTSGLLGVLVRFKAPLIPFLILLLTIDVKLKDSNNVQIMQIKSRSTDV